MFDGIGNRVLLIACLGRSRALPLGSVPSQHISHHLLFSRLQIEVNRYRRSPALRLHLGQLFLDIAPLRTIWVVVSVELAAGSYLLLAYHPQHVAHRPLDAPTPDPSGTFVYSLAHNPARRDIRRQRRHAAAGLRSLDKSP